MLLREDKDGEPIIQSSPVAVTGTVHVLGPFTASKAEAQQNFVCGGVTEESVVAETSTDARGRFEVALPPGRYVLVGHVPKERFFNDLSAKFPQLLRVNSAIQFVSQVVPPSVEKACSHRAVVAVISDHRYRTVIGVPL
jgi:hypothetical protein